MKSEETNAISVKVSVTSHGMMGMMGMMVCLNRAPLVLVHTRTSSLGQRLYTSGDDPATEKQSALITLEFGAHFFSLLF